MCTDVSISSHRKKNRHNNEANAHMKSYISLDKIPVGYYTPEFPSLFIPLGNYNNNYSLSYLYYTYDIWKFTVYWSLIFYGAFYLSASVWAAINHRKFIHSIWIITLYAFVGSVQAFISGTVVGIIVAEIYAAGNFSMSTWIPFIWGAIQILFVIISSYSVNAIIL